MTISELAGELRPHRRMALRAMLVATAVVCGVLLLSTKLDLKALGDVITDANPDARVRGAGREPGVGGRQGSHLEGVAGGGRGHPGSRWRARRAPERALLEVVPAIFIGFLLNTVLFARLGEVARISVLRRKLSARGVEVPVPTMVGTLVTEQLLSGVTLIAVLVGVTVFVSVPGWAMNLLLVLIGVVLVIAVAACAIEVWARYRRGNVPTESDIVERWWHLLGISLGALPMALRQGQALFRRPRLLLWALLTSTVSWLAQMVGILWALEAYGIEKGIGAAALVFLASNLVGLFPIVPGNLVVFQGATYTALQVYNVPTNTRHHVLDRPAADRGGAGRRHRLLLPQLRGPVGGRAASRGRGLQQGQRAVVEGAADHGAVGTGAGHRRHVGRRPDPAGGHQQARHARPQARQQGGVGPVTGSVPLDRGDQEVAHAGLGQRPYEGLGRDPGVLQPARRPHRSLAHVGGHRHTGGVTGQPPHQLRLRRRQRAHQHARHPQLERLQERTLVADAAPHLDGHAGVAHQPPDRLGMGGRRTPSRAADRSITCSRVAPCSA